MSTNLNYKQVANVERRTWDLEAYEKRAQERAKNDQEGNTTTSTRQKTKKKKSKEEILGTLGPHAGNMNDDDENKEEFQPAIKGAAGPEKSDRAFLKARRSRVDVDSKIGSVEMINPEAVSVTKANVGDPGSNKDGVTKSGVGWHCKVCDCFLRDSHAYLDHINGRKHQRNLGYTMRVERSTKEQVSSRLAQLAKLKKERKNKLVDESEENFHDIVKENDRIAQQRKEERQRQRKERRKMKKELSQQQDLDVDLKQAEDLEKIEEEKSSHDNEDTNETEEIHPDLATMMGFSGFK